MGHGGNPASMHTAFIRRYVRDPQRPSGMPDWGDKFAPQEIDNVLVFLGTIQKKL